jgi:hypothetical protein
LFLGGEIFTSLQQPKKRKKKKKGGKNGGANDTKDFILKRNETPSRHIMKEKKII